MIVRAAYQRWSDGQVIEVEVEEADLFKLDGDVLRVRRPVKKSARAAAPDPRVVAARAFGQARKL